MMQKVHKRGRRIALASIAVVIGSVLGMTGCAAPGGTPDASEGVGDEHAGDLEFWFYGEDDLPGLNDWMQGRIDAYEELYPDVSINLVPQDGKNLVGAFNLAAESNDGPDIASLFGGARFISAVAAGYVAPIGDLVPTSETDNWLRPDVFDGKVQGVPLAMSGIQFVWNKSLFEEAGLDPEALPESFDEFLDACQALRAIGVTPIASSNKNGIFGTWLFSIFSRQALDSSAEFASYLSGEKKFSEGLIAGWYDTFKQLLDSGCLNDDVASIDYEQTVQQFAQGKAAIVASTDGGAVDLANYIGAENLGVGRPPLWENQELAQTANTGPGAAYFVTSWSEHKAAAAAFLAWLHEDENIVSLNGAVGALPADTRFDVSTVQDPVLQSVYEVMRSDPPFSVFRLIPPYVDQNANIVASQMITSGTGTPEEAAKTWDTAIEQWRARNPEEYKVYEAWLSQQ